LYCAPFLFFFSCSRHPRPLPSFPTRRSSDLARCSLRGVLAADFPPPVDLRDRSAESARADPSKVRSADRRLHPPVLRRDRFSGRSEEHTSELQSRRVLVFRLLLEEKSRNLAL